MHRHARGLVDHQQVLVLEADRELAGRGGRHRRLAQPRCRRQRDAAVEHHRVVHRAVGAGQVLGTVGADPTQGKQALNLGLEALAVGLAERRRAARIDAAAAQLFHEFAHGELLLDIVFGVELAARIERFAALVAAAENEACAKLVQDNSMACDPGSMLQVYLASNAAAIRARGQA